MPTAIADLSVQTFEVEPGKTGLLFSLPNLEEQGIGPVSKLPICLRIILESVLRHCDGSRITQKEIYALANWQPQAPRTEEIPFIVSRILLQDFTGVPLLADLAAMRAAAARLNANPKIIEPLVPVDLVVDHSVQVDYSSVPDALQLNMEMEFKRNSTRYQFLKWGMQAFKSFNVVPPGIGIVHQVNLEYLAKGIMEKDGVYSPDTLVGTDSHTTMINGLGVVGWGVGGIEAEAGMLGQPIYFLTPDVVGVHLTGSLREGVTATDLVLYITKMLRNAKVVGKFVEFHGEGAERLSIADRATISNMAPEYGATIGYFPVDEETCRYLHHTGRTLEQVNAMRSYFEAQGMFGMPKNSDIEYSMLLELDLNDIQPCVAGPKRPQDSIYLPDLKSTFLDLLQKPLNQNGYNKSPDELAKRYHVKTGVDGTQQTPITGGGEQDPETAPEIVDPTGLTSDKDTATETELEMMSNRPTPDRLEEIRKGEFPRAQTDLGNGDIVIAAITSCTNTSNPSVMLAAGLVAKKAVERGMTLRPTVKASLAPGSRVVTDYLEKAGLQSFLDQLGFNTVAYGCTTCIGNSGPLDPKIENLVHSHDLVVASVLSGNRNFEARVHQSVRANFLMSPPLVIIYALAGRIDVDVLTDPIGQDTDGKDVFLSDLWPTSLEIETLLEHIAPQAYQTIYSQLSSKSPMWESIPAPQGELYAWDPNSTYILEPPFLRNFSLQTEPIRNIYKARPLAILGDSVTTDHISPAGAIMPDSPAGWYLRAKGVEPGDFNSYGSRRGNDRVMTRGTFANVRVKNFMTPGLEGGVTALYPGGERLAIYDAAVRYQGADVPLLIFAGHEYGTGSSRDWAAKGTRLLGVKAVIAESFERIHRSNLVGMGVLPLQFQEGVNAQTLGLDGTETFDVCGLEDISPHKIITLVIHRANGETLEIPLVLRIDTPIEVEYYQHGGILPYVLRQLIQSTV